MTEKIRVGFDGEFRDQGDRRLAPDDPGALGPLAEVLDRRNPRPPSRRSGQGDRRGALLDRRAPAGNALRRGSCAAPGGRHGQVDRPRRRRRRCRACRPRSRSPSRARKSASRARRSPPSPPTPPSGPATPSRRSGVAYEQRPFVVGIEAASQARRAPRLRGQGRDKDLRRGGRGAQVRAPPQRQRPGPPPERQGQRRGRASGRPTPSSRRPTSRRSRPTRPSRPTAWWRTGTAAS